MRRMSEGECGRQGGRRNGPLRLLVAAAALLLLVFASLSGPENSSAATPSAEVSAGDFLPPSGSMPDGFDEECAVHLAVCGAMLQSAASVSELIGVARTVDRIVLLPGSGRAPERIPPPPKHHS